MITEQQLQEWQRMCDEATKGEWIWRIDYAGTEVENCELWGDDGKKKVMDDGSAGSEYSQIIRHDSADGYLIAAARTALPALIAEVLRLRKELENKP